MTTPTPTPPVPPAPAPTAPVASPAAPAASTAPTASTPTAPVPPPPPPAPPEPPEDDDEVRRWPTWVTVLLSSALAVIITVAVFWLIGAFTISARIGEAVDPTPVVVVETKVVEATAAMPEATATTEPAKAPEATAQPTAEAPKPTKAPPKPTAVPPAPTQVPTAVPPTAIPPAPTQVPPFGWSSGEYGSTDVPAGAICWGDQISFDGATFGDGVGPANPVWLTLTKPAKVTMVYGACTTGESWATISDRLKKAPDTSGKTFDPK